jgi:hypothetical protein
MLIGAALFGVPATAVVLLSHEPWATPVGAGLAAAAAACFAAATLFDRLGRRRRCFVVNFTAHTLRLDFSTRFRGMPRTLLVPFERIERIEPVTQGDGRVALVVEVGPGDGIDHAFREVLIADIREEEFDSLERVTRVLENGIGLRGDSFTAPSP